MARLGRARHQLVEQAAQLGLTSARTVTFPSVVLANERPLLVQVKAVEPPYPLRGRLQVDTPEGPRPATVHETFWI